MLVLVLALALVLVLVRERGPSLQQLRLHQLVLGGLLYVVQEELQHVLFEAVAATARGVFACLSSTLMPPSCSIPACANVPPCPTVSAPEQNPHPALCGVHS